MYIVFMLSVRKNIFFFKYFRISIYNFDIHYTFYSCSPTRDFTSIETESNAPMLDFPLY